MSSGPVLGSRSVIGPAYGAGRPRGGTEVPAGNLSGCPANFPTCRTCRSTPASSTSSTSVSWSPTVRWAPCCRTRASRRPGVRRLRRARGLQRDPQRHPPGRRRRHPPRLLRGRRGRGGDQHVRGEPAQPRRLRHRRTGSASSPRRAPGSPGRSPTRWRPRTGRGSCSARSAPARSCRRWATSPTPACATPTPSAAAGCSPAAATRWSSRPARTCCRSRRRCSALKARDARRGPARADHHPRHRRDHRHDAARQRDRRRADRARAAGRRPHRPELRHRPGRDERAPAHPGQARAHPAVGDAERRPARSWARAARCTRSARTSWPRRSPGSSATTGCGWSAAAAGRPRRTSAPSPTRSRAGHARAAPPAPGAGRQLALRAGAVPPGHLGADGRASGPTPTARKAFREAMLAQRLGGLRRDRPRADPRRRAPDRPVRRLRRPRRRRRHGRAGRPAGHRVHAADHARLHRAGGAARRAGAPRRPLDRQLGELRGRRRPRARASSGRWRWSASTARRSSRCASTRRARPAPPSGRSGSRTG